MSKADRGEDARFLNDFGRGDSATGGEDSFSNFNGDKRGFVGDWSVGEWKRSRWLGDSRSLVGVSSSRSRALTGLAGFCTGVKSSSWLLDPILKDGRSLVSVLSSALKKSCSTS